MVTYIFSAVFFTIGVYVGIRIAIYVGGKMVDQGQAVFRADGKWEGEEEAFRSIRGMFIE